MTSNPWGNLWGNSGFGSDQSAAPRRDWINAPAWNAGPTANTPAPSPAPAAPSYSAPASSSANPWSSLSGNLGATEWTGLNQDRTNWLTTHGAIGENVLAGEFWNPAMTAAGGIMDQSAISNQSRDMYEDFARNGGGMGPSANYYDVMRNTVAHADAANRNFGDFRAGMYGATPVSQNLQAMARGENLGANPYSESLLQNTLDDITRRNKGIFSNNGRFGSDTHSRALSDELGQTANAFRARQYDMDRGLQMQANSMLQGAFDTDQSRRMAAASQMQAGVAADEQMRMANADRLQGAFDNQQARHFAGIQGLYAFDQADRNARMGGLQSQAGLQANIAAQRSGDRANMIPTLQNASMYGYPTLASLSNTEANTAATLAGIEQRNRQLALQAEQLGLNRDQFEASQPSTAESLLGGAIGGASIGNALGFDPVLGAVGGGLLSLF